MIDYIKYTIDGVTFDLINNGDGTWSRNINAPDISGRYNLLLEIGQGGNITFIDSSDQRYSFYLEVIKDIEKKADLIKYLPKNMEEILEFKVLFDAENNELDTLYDHLNINLLDSFIQTASIQRIKEIEDFLRFKGVGSLEQRRSYLLALFRKGKKLNEQIIKEVTNTIAGSDSIVTFYGSDEMDNPESGFGVLLVQVLSPDNNKDYRYEDIFRALSPLIPGHLKLIVIKYFATWGDILSNFADWNTVAQMADWQAVKNYIPPQ